MITFHLSGVSPGTFLRKRGSCLVTPSQGSHSGSCLSCKCEGRLCTMRVTCTVKGTHNSLPDATPQHEYRRSPPLMTPSFKLNYFRKDTLLATESVQKVTSHIGNN
jgi:hypothetical protein